MDTGVSAPAAAPTVVSGAPPAPTASPFGTPSAEALDALSRVADAAMTDVPPQVEELRAAAAQGGQGTAAEDGEEQYVRHRVQ